MSTKQFLKLSSVLDMLFHFLAFSYMNYSQSYGLGVVLFRKLLASSCKDVKFRDAAAKELYCSSALEYISFVMVRGEM